MRYLLILFLMGAPFRAVLGQGLAQTVLVLDSLDDRPIAEVALRIGGELAAVTDTAGRCTIAWDRHTPLSVRFEHVAFAARTLRLTARTRLDAGTWTIRLVPRDVLLAPVAVGRSTPEVVFQRKDLHAADLLINDAGMWVLAYEHPRMLRAAGDAEKEILRDVRLVLLDTNFQELASCPVPEDVFGLRHDLRRDVVIEGTVHAFGVARQGDALVLEPFGLEQLRRAVLPWTDSIPGWVVGSNADGIRPAFDHLAYDPPHDSSALICSVVDTFMMDLFRSGYKYMKGPEKVQAMRLADELRVDKETVAGYMSGFQHNIWFRPVYAPLFVVGDTLLVFDHAKGRMRKFTRDFRPSGERPLEYLRADRRHDRAGRVLQDARRETLYAVYRRYGATWLRSIDPVTGALGERWRIALEYPERVQVHDGVVYYITRPEASLQKRTIYREQLP